VLRVHRVRKAQRVEAEVELGKEHKEQLAHKDQRVLEVQPDHKEQQELLELKVKLEIEG
jgi:hypothetical protein